jgi:hypothetical protein
MYMAMKAYIAPSTRPKVPIRASVAAKTRPTYQIITYLFFIFEGTFQFFETKAIYFRPARVRDSSEKPAAQRSGARTCSG